MSLDMLDRKILEAVLEETLWKRGIFTAINTHSSYTTVCRHVDQLEEDGYLERTLVRGDDVDRTLLDGFKLTEKGREALNETSGGNLDE